VTAICAMILVPMVLMHRIFRRRDL